LGNEGSPFYSDGFYIRGILLKNDCRTLLRFHLRLQNVFDTDVGPHLTCPAGYEPKASGV
jgi:hypothetical protein